MIKNIRKQNDDDDDDNDDDDNDGEIKYDTLRTERLVYSRIIRL